MSCIFFCFSRSFRAFCFFVVIGRMTEAEGPKRQPSSRQQSPRVSVPFRAAGAALTASYDTTAPCQSVCAYVHACRVCFVFFWPFWRRYFWCICTSYDDTVSICALVFVVYLMCVLIWCLLCLHTAVLFSAGPQGQLDRARGQGARAGSHRRGN